MIELKDRELVELPWPRGVWPRPQEDDPFMNVGIALDNSEAQSYMRLGLRVHCDEDGPYLIMRVPRGMTFVVADKYHVDVKFEVWPWEFHGRSGIQCRLESIR